MTEAQLVVATVAQRYRLRLVPGHPVELHPLMTLRPRHGMRMTLHPADDGPRLKLSGAPPTDEFSTVRISRARAASDLLPGPGLNR